MFLGLGIVFVEVDMVVCKGGLFTIGVFPSCLIDFKRKLFPHFLGFSFEKNKYNPSLILAFKISHAFNKTLTSIFNYEEETQ